jgi:uncharacterized protein DUF6152
MKARTAVAAAFLLAAVEPASAHHSLSSYIVTKPKAVTGTVKLFEWTNPHSKLVVEVLGSNGLVTEWNFEGPSLARLAAAGIKKDSMAPGDRVTVTYGPRRDGKPGGLFVAATYPDGKTLRLKRDPNFRENSIDGF